ncbi:MAG: hypothetical protein ABI868_20630 [Acidobacteriota bacterium]
MFKSRLVESTPWHGCCTAGFIRMGKQIRAGGAIAALVLMAACDQAGTITDLPRPTTPPAKVVSFSGTLQPQATDSYTFTVTQEGYVEATLVGLSAAAGTAVSLGIGTATAASTCAVIQSVTTVAGTAAQVIGTGLPGTLCVTISDVGNLTAPALYTITVASS